MEVSNEIDHTCTRLTRRGLRYAVAQVKRHTSRLSHRNRELAKDSECPLDMEILRGKARIFVSTNENTVDESNSKTTNRYLISDRSG